MKKVLVGMSGGVDSSAAAVILKERGYDVTGCTLRLYDNADIGESKEKGCCSADDVSDAKSVCRKIGIDHITLNFGEYFKRHVMKPFAEEYIRGGIPNPCIECNRHIKFDMMLRQAELLGFDYIATGHYARIEERGGKYELHRSGDRRKDQTYVLCYMNQYRLGRTLFPLWDITKEQTRELAEARGLINSGKPDSQDICFVPDGDYVKFIERFSGHVPCGGDFLGEDGRVMGRHKGYVNYTIGQRKGLGAAFGRPVYVTGKDPEKN
ncbi:MAG: tRNA 2-thiouridine(34) synthase MnmA, partial [Ruminococcus sp.]|nr:tRNA 2-thiouridine(34) synthase MnmA [Ruminococcus sp.]